MTRHEDQKGEFELIDWISSRAAAMPKQYVKIGIGDDMAQLQLPDGQVLVSCDMILDGVHFDTGKHSYRQIGYKALACNLSDCAAMAARPVAALVSVALSEGMSTADAQEIFIGMEALSGRFDCPIVGGDITSWSGKLAIDVTVLAQPCKAGPVRRDRAREGDLIFVTGKLGGSRAGKHLQFQPRIEQACWLAENWAVHAMIDISDGLVADLQHICRSSGVGALLDAEKLGQVVSPEAVKLSESDGVPALEHALHDGEDFELIAVCDPDLPRLHLPPADLVLTMIGRAKKSPGIYLQQPDGKTIELESRGYEHFRSA